MEQQYRAGEGPVALIDGAPLTITEAELSYWLDDDRYSNTPHLDITLSREFDYPALRWQRLNGWWWAECDGFVMAHYHSDGTSQQEGYGGRHFKIMMKNGEEVTLKGPWHGNTASFFQETGIRLVEIHTRTVEEAKKGPGRGYSFGWWATIPRAMEALALVKLPFPLFQVHLMLDKANHHNFAIMKGMNRRPQVFETDWLYYDHMNPKGDPMKEAKRA